MADNNCCWNNNNDSSIVGAVLAGLSLCDLSSLLDLWNNRDSSPALDENEQLRFDIDEGNFDIEENNFIFVGCVVVL